MSGSFQPTCNPSASNSIDWLTKVNAYLYLHYITLQSDRHRNKRWEREIYIWRKLTFCSFTVQSGESISVYGYASYKGFLCVRACNCCLKASKFSPNNMLSLVKHNLELLLPLTKVSFFVQCIKRQLITLQNFNIQTFLIQFLWFFSLKFWVFLEFTWFCLCVLIEASMEMGMLNF